MSRLRKFAALALLLGAGALVGHWSLQDRKAWNPIMLPLDNDVGAIVSERFTTTHTDTYEIQLEVDKTLSKETLEQIVGTQSPSTLEVFWEVSQGDVIVASGNVEDYVYIAPGPRSKKAVWRRLLLRVPFDRNQAHWNTWGTKGAFTVARGVGQFQGVADDEFKLSVRHNGIDLISEGKPHMVVRRSRRSWDQHYQTLAPLAYAGLGLLSLSVGLGVLSLFTRREQ